MDGQVVKNDDIAPDDIALVQCRRELRLDVEVEHLTIHGALEDPGRVKPVVAQRGDKCLRVPMAMRRVVDQAFPARGGVQVRVGREVPAVGALPRHRLTPPGGGKATPAYPIIFR